MSIDRIAALKQFIEKDPEDWLSMFLLGLEYMRAADYPAAAEVLARCVVVNSDYSAAWKQLGDAWRKQGELEKALDIYRLGLASALRKKDDQVEKECVAFIRQLEKKLAKQSPEQN